MEGKGGDPASGSNRAKSSTGIGQTVTDTGFLSHCFKQWITVFISLIFPYKLPENLK